ncbi:unnamed protein product [Leuciscus chuanchicus]
MVDEALVNMVIKDSQPFTVVEDEGFKGLIHALDPSYIIPTRHALKKMVASKYEEAKRKAKANMEKATAVSITSDMWTSINMDAYLAITCHYIDDSYKLNTVLLDVEKFPNRHTAENMALVKTNDKVKCLVTDAAANMIACARILQVRHSVCIAHALNTMVKKSFDRVPALCDIRNKAKKVVTYFRSSTSAKEMLNQVQQEMNRPVLKLVNEDYEAIQQILCVLAPFHQATVELSEEKRVSGSKVIPLLKMIHHSLQVEQLRLTMPITKELTENLIRRLREHIWNMESLSIMTMATLLEPRFKKLGFLHQTKMTEAVKWLKAECGDVIRAEDERPSTSSSTQSTEAPSSTQQPTPSSTVQVRPKMVSVGTQTTRIRTSTPLASPDNSDEEASFIRSDTSWVPDEEDVSSDEEASYEEPPSHPSDLKSDSPGHCAKYGTYSLIEERINKVVDLQLVQCSEVPNSNWCELEGLKRSITLLRGQDLQVSTLITDRHRQVAKWVREEMCTEGTRHFFDVWHVGKGLSKALDTAAKEKDCGDLMLWRPAIINHLYWTAASTPDGNPEVMEAKWKSMVNHIQDIHKHDTPAFPCCAHLPLEGEQWKKEWLEPGSTVAVKLEGVVTKASLLKDVKQLSPQHQTFSLEAFHSLILLFAPNTQGFLTLGCTVDFYWQLCTSTVMAAAKLRKQVVVLQSMPCNTRGSGK